MARGCWARALGNCSGKISGEHLLSKCVLPEKTVVTGLWSNEPKVLPRQSLTANILCEGHNNQLSPIDAEAGRFVAALESISSVIEQRLRIVKGEKPSARRGGKRKKRWAVPRHRVNRLVFERWLAKSLINISVAMKQPVGSGGTDELPDEALVRMVFGCGDCAEIDVSAGVAAGESVAIERRHGVSLVTANNSKGSLREYVAGGILTFATFPFIVRLETPGFGDDVVEKIFGGTFESCPLGLMNFKVAGQLSHRVELFPWSEGFLARQADLGLRSV